MAAVNQTRAGYSVEVADLGRVVDRNGDALRAQLNPIVAPLGPSGLKAYPWIYVTAAGFLNGWSNLGAFSPPLRYLKDASGWVTLSGVVTGGTVATDLTGTIFVLPMGYRPAYGLPFAVDSNGAYARVYVSKYGNSTKRGLQASSGMVTCTIGSNAALSLEGIRFLAEQ